MELEAIKPAAVAEELVGGESGRGEAHACGRKIEDIPMPVRRHKICRQVAQKRVVFCDRVERDGKKSDFATCAGTHRSAEGGGHQLGAEAESEDRFSGMGRLPDQIAFQAQVGVFFRLIGTLRPAAHGKPAERLQRRGQHLAKIRMGDLDSHPAALERFRQKAGLVRLSMLDK